METKEELELLQAEILNLFNYIQRVRKEVAAITRSDEGNGRFDNMSDQLDAIVKATEEATNSIEQNTDTIDKIREKTDNPEILALLDELENNSSNIFEACTFQDITGQRVTKIARSVTYVESRVNTLIQIFGKEHIESVEIEDEDKTEDEQLLQGPQLQGEGVTQDEIDKLFD